MEKQLIGLRTNQILYNEIDDGGGYIQFFRVTEKISETRVFLELMDCVCHTKFFSIDRHDCCWPAIIVNRSSRSSLIIYFAKASGITGRSDMRVFIRPRLDYYIDLNSFGKFDKETSLETSSFSELWDIWHGDCVHSWTALYYEQDARWQAWIDEQDMRWPQGGDQLPEAEFEVPR